MKIVEIEGKLYKDPTGYGLEYVPIEETAIEEAYEGYNEYGRYDEYDELYPERPIEV